MKRSYRWLCLAGLLLSMAGCLSLGTKHVHDNPETKERINNLERRISVMENRLYGTPVEIP